MHERIDWNDIEVLLAVACSGSLSAAARQLNSSQPTIGRRLARLQDSSGLRLLEKTPYGFRLTAAGERLIGSAQDVTAAHEKFARTLDLVRSTFQSIVRIRAGEWMTRIVNALLPELGQAFPGGLVLLETGPRPTDNRVRSTDLIIRHGPAEKNRFQMRHLGTTPYAAFGSRDYVNRVPEAMSGDRYEQCDWALISKSSLVEGAENEKVEWGYPSLSSGTRIFRCTSVHSMLDLVTSGHALGFLPTFVGQELSLVQVSTAVKSLEHDYWLTYLSDARANPHLRMVAKMLGRRVSQYLSRANQMSAGFTAPVEDTNMKLLR